MLACDQGYPELNNFLRCCYLQVYSLRSYSSVKRNACTTRRCYFQLRGGRASVAQLLLPRTPQTRCDVT